jgi:hypothetical protein
MALYGQNESFAKGKSSREARACDAGGEWGDARKRCETEGKTFSC